MEGGKYILAMFSELLQELLGEGNISGVASVVCKLYEAAEIPIELNMLIEDNIAAWVALFAEVLRDTSEEKIF